MNLTEQITKAFELQREYKTTIRNSSIDYRVEKLIRFRDLMLSHIDDIKVALKDDFSKPELETQLTEVMPLLTMINETCKNLHKWSRPKKLKTPILFLGSKSQVVFEGKGQCLVIAPWNYPFHLALYPALTSFSAGNTTIIKPSEFTPSTNKIMKKLVREIFTPAEMEIIEGEVEASTLLLEKPFDHVFFTGSTQVGKVVMRAAAEHLASVSLELGGKSPTVIDSVKNMKKVVRKILWGKLVNGGQTCIAPDYLLIHKDELSSFIDSTREVMHELYTEGKIELSKDLCRVITQKHTKRLADLIENAKELGAKVELGGNYNVNERFIEPTILSSVTKEMLIMQEEIFGPILPIITFSNTSDAIDIINSYDNALTMYVFSDQKNKVNQYMNKTFNGMVTINDCLLSAGHPELPFGGNGKSGLGKYHGFYGFEELSNKKSLMVRKGDRGASYFYPPYDVRKESIVDWLFDKFRSLL